MKQDKSGAISILKKAASSFITGQKMKARSSTTGAFIRANRIEYEEINRRNNWIYPRAALVGAATGITALLFRAGLEKANDLRLLLITWARHFPGWGWIFPVLFGTTGTILAVMLTRKLSPEAGGSGIPHLKAVQMRIRKMRWKKLLPVKFFGGIIAIGSGLTLGREGPTIQMGGAVGDAISRFLKVPVKERIILIAAGAGAGLAAAFNAPLAGLIFVLEEVQRDFQRTVFGAAFVAAAVASIVGQIGFGQNNAFIIPSYPMVPLKALFLFIPLGVAAGFIAYAFNRGLIAVSGFFQRLRPHWFVLAAAITGASVGLTGWFFPDLAGSGHQLAEQALRGETLLLLIPVFLFIRYILTAGSYATGAPGGIFAPILVIGALSGLLMGRIAQLVTPEMIQHPEVFSIVGMAACFTSIVQAPLTGIVIIIEMTGNYEHMLPLLVSCFCAYGTARILKVAPVYESLLERDLDKDAHIRPMLDPAVIEFTIRHGVPFEGKAVRDLALPKGCLLLRLTDGNREWVPDGDSVLDAHLKATFIISQDSRDAIDILRKGCGTKERSAVIREL